MPAMKIAALQDRAPPAGDAGSNLCTWPTNAVVLGSPVMDGDTGRPREA